MNAPPVPFGDPSQVRLENQGSVGKGVFLGCSGCLLLVAIVIALWIGGCTMLMRTMVDSDVSRQAMDKARSSPEVCAILGTPIDRDLFFSGNFNLNNNDGSANVTLSISGPKGKAALHFIATKKNGVWTFSTLEVKPENGSPPIDLLGAKEVI